MLAHPKNGADENTYLQKLISSGCKIKTGGLGDGKLNQGIKTS
jgi:hypothetical protein